MKPQLKLRLLACTELVLLVAFVTQLQSHFDFAPSTQHTATTAANQLANLPLAFEPNLGQTDQSVQYLVHQGKATTYFTPTKTILAIGDDHLDMQLKGANAEPSFLASEQLKGKINYFIGNDPSKWHSNVPIYKNLNVTNVYPGIDVTYYGNDQHSLEHDFIVAAGADPKQIAMSFEGQQQLSLNADGSILLKLASIDLALHAPTTYQKIDGERHKVDSQYQVNADNTVSIALGEYDHDKTLVIDPTVSLLYSTYLGGSGEDHAYNTARDASDPYQFISGITKSSDFPLNAATQGSLAGGSGQDVFVTVLSGDGSGLVYSTYLGGSGDELAGNEGLAVDGGGNAYVTGSTTSTDFPLLNEYQSTNAGGHDAFVTKLDVFGASMIYSTYLGGSGEDEVNGSGGIAVNSGGEAFVTGSTDSPNFPTTGGVFQSSPGGGVDAFVTRMSNDGSSLSYSTYVGGTGFDQSAGIAVDGFDNVYITGLTSGDFPISGGFQTSMAGVIDAFVTKLNASGSALTYSSYLGGGGFDLGRSIVVDSTGNAYVAGQTDSSNLPIASGFQATYGGSGDGFISKVSSSGSALLYSTYLGGSGGDGILSIAVDGTGYAYVTGFTSSTDFPLEQPFQASYGGGTNDAFVTKLNLTGSALAYSSYFGGTGDDGGGGISVNSDGDAYVSAGTDSSNFPVTGGAYQGSYAGGIDGVAFKIASLGNLFVTVAPILTFAISPTSCNVGHFSTSETKFCTHLIAAATNATNGYTISYIPTTTLTSGANTINAMTSTAASVLGIEQFGLNLKANTAAGSLTATDFGADPAGGSGYALTGYDASDQFTFKPAGDYLAQSVTPSDLTTYTASYIVNIAGSSEAGFYSTPITYAIAPSY